MFAGHHIVQVPLHNVAGTCQLVETESLFIGNQTTGVTSLFHVYPPVQSDEKVVSWTGQSNNLS